jgi:hypothetical protein
MSIINTLVEGDLDEAAAGKLVRATHHTPGVCYGKHGWNYIRNKIQGFNQAARVLHCLALVDLMDTGLACAPEIVTQWLPHRRPKMLFRVVVRELESWLKADRGNLADFLSVDLAMLPIAPEQLADPKRELVNIARRSRYQRIRSALVPAPESTAQVGKLYVSEMKQFIDERRDLEVARTAAPSLGNNILDNSTDWRYRRLIAEGTAAPVEPTIAPAKILARSSAL